MYPFGLPTLTDTSLASQIQEQNRDKRLGTEITAVHIHRLEGGKGSCRLTGCCVEVGVRLPVQANWTVVVTGPVSLPIQEGGGALPSLEPFQGAGFGGSYSA